MKKRSISHIRREYDAPSEVIRTGFKPFASTRYWFQQALRAVAIVRREAVHHGLTEKEAPSEPFALFQAWFQDALRAKVLDANAMTLATVSGKGRPSTRIVLLKDFDVEGFVFYTNYQSGKGMDLTLHPYASLLFFWSNLMRQVRVDGRVEKVTPKESDEYFQSRPRGSQISAWASRQSRVVPDRGNLERQMREIESRFKGRPVTRPPHWGGYRLVPGTVEFWSGRPNRLHDRLRYTRTGPNGWKVERLSP